MSFIIAIDGPSGTGKGTISKIIADKFKFQYLDTGAMYRCVTLKIIREKVNLENEEKIKEILKNIKIDLDGEKVFLDGEDVTRTIREEKVTNFVSEVSKNAIIRANLVELQRRISEGKNIVVDGRDIGTVVFPNAEIKIYLDATPEERANRRIRQNKEKGIESTYEEVLKNIKFRDNNDKTSKVAPLKQADDAIYLDTTELQISEVVEKICEIIESSEKWKSKNKLTKKQLRKIKKEEKSSSKFDKKEDTIWTKLQRRIVWGFLRSYYKIFYRVKIEGTENVPKDGAFILCGNHIDFMKVPVVVVYCPRKVNFMGKIELFNNPFLARLGKLFDVIPVKRGKQDVDAMKKSLKVLNNKEVLGIFPEGTTKGLEKGVKVKNGAAFMAIRTGKPILPVGVEVTKGPFSKIIVRYGKPLDYSQYKSKTPEKENLDKVTKEMMDTIIKLANL